jgi:hypothetical protein
LQWAKTPTKNHRESSEPYYDLSDDWSLIYASFQTQYGIRLSQDLQSMSWREFSYLINGLSGDTPLGRIVSIRAEDDPERLKEFTKEEKQIRNEYRRKSATKKTEKETDRALEGIKQAFMGMAK